MLRNRLPEIEIPVDDPFKYDKLNRISCADTFTSIVKLYSSTGCVIALNGEWGTGKTTFVNMLIQKMKNEGGHPLYFNAWENDYVSDPLIALLAEFKNLFPQSSKWDNVIANGGKILTSFAVSAGKSFIKNKLGVDSEMPDLCADEIANMLKKDIDNFSKQKNTFNEFREALQNYIADNTSEEVPVVFFIDELDRCNPKFAVLVLERIKHLFDIPNIIFVLSINKIQLSYAIQGYYGSSNINADNYLRRFIDIEYSLPKPKTEDFCKYLYNNYQFDNVFNHKDRQQYHEFSSDGHHFKRMAEILISSSNIDIRTTDKIFAHTRLSIMGFNKKNDIIPDVYFILCYMKIAKPELYNSIIQEKYTSQELLNELEDFFPKELYVKNDYNSTWRQMTYTIASFVFMYNLDDSGREREHILTSTDGESNTVVAKHLDSDTFIEALKWSSRMRFNGEIPLRYLIQKIELEQAIII